MNNYLGSWIFKDFFVKENSKIPKFVAKYESIWVRNISIYITNPTGK